MNEIDILKDLVSFNTIKDKENQKILNYVEQFLSKLGFNNYKIATTPNEISYKSTGHIWNAVYYDNKWVHIDLTWDDPVSKDKKDYLFHTYFLVTTEAMKEADEGETVIEEHNFNPLFYLEFN